MSQYFGFELLLSSVSADVKEKSDLVAVVFHWLLIRENFLCLGVGTERELLDTDTPSELLPAGWHENKETYYLRYFNAEASKVLVLDVTMASQDEAVITIAGDDEVTKGFTMNVPDYLGELDLATNSKTKIHHIMPRIDELMYKFLILFRQLVPPEQKDAATTAGAATPAPQGSVPIGPRPTQPGATPLNSDILRDPMAQFRDVGRGDLDPFHRGGGMLGIGPQRTPHVRYDPVGPLPIHDHFPPPGGSGFLTDPDGLLNLNPNRRGPKRPGNDMFPPPPGPGGFDWYG